VKAEAGILETDSPDVAASKINAIVPDTDPDAPWLRQRLRPLVGLEAPQAAREENFAGWRRFLESLAEADPSVFVFEDLHWADDALLAFLEHLGDYAEGVPMLLVGTARPELFEKAPGFAQSARNANRINLAPLSEPETARLISNLLESAVLPAEVQQAILSQAGGNPLYAEEFVRLLKDRGVLHRAGTTWTIDPDVEIPMPSGVQGIIAARLDTLSPERKRMLSDAAVLGKVFWAGAVAAMGDRDPAEVEQALHELSRKELIRPARRSSMEGQAEYAFFHAVVRDVCYAQIPRAQRAEQHVKAAAWIEEVAQDRVEDHAEILASHYVTALELVRTARDTGTAEVEDKAIRYLTLAGDRAIGMDVQAAERHYAKALELISKDHPERPDVLARHAEALRQRGRFPEAALAFEEAIEGLRAKGDLRRAAAAMGRYGIVLWRMGDPREKVVVAQALAALEPLGPSAELAEALTEKATVSLLAGDLREGIEFADRAIRLTHSLELPEPVRAMGFRGAARCMLGDAGGLEEMHSALEAARGQGLSREVALLYTNLTGETRLIEGPRAAGNLNREGAAFAEQRGIEEFTVYFAIDSMSLLADLGSWDEVLNQADALVPQIEEVGDAFALRQVRANQITVLSRRGELAAAAPLAEWAEGKVRETANAQDVAGTFSVAAHVRLANRDSAGALSLLAELEQTPNIRDQPNYAWELPEAVRTALAAGDPDLAARLADGVEPVYPMHEHALATARALLAEHRGEYAVAAEAFADTAARWERFEVTWERAQALLGQGRCLLALGQATDATGPLRDAREIFASLGAKPALAETDVLLERAVARTS